MSLRVIKWDSPVQVTLQLLRTWGDHRRALHWLWGQVPWTLDAVVVMLACGFFVVLENGSKVLGLSLSPVGSSLSRTISSIVPLSC